MLSFTIPKLILETNIYRINLFIVEALALKLKSMLVGTNLGYFFIKSLRFKH